MKVKKHYNPGNLMAWAGLMIVLPFMQCGSPKAPITNDATEKKTLEVVSNNNIHFSHIIELYVWPGEYPTRPIIVDAYRYFDAHKQHPAITFSDSLLKNEIFYFDELTEVLLYADDFPKRSFKLPLAYSPYSDRQDILTEWVNLIIDFYEDSNAEHFFTTHQDFYEGAILEVKANLPKMDFVQEIEAYYRESRLSYTIIPGPEMPTGGEYGTRGIGPYVYTADGLHIYQVISASLPVPYSNEGQYEYYGFDNEENTLRMSFHEFGHAFVNPMFESDTSLLTLVSASEHLFTPEWQRIMAKQNYVDWLTVIEEHFVRLGEIRLAQRTGKTAWAEELREMHTEELQFIFLPYLEELILEYEDDASYKEMKDFVPGVLQGLAKFETEYVDRSLLSNRR